MLPSQITSASSISCRHVLPASLQADPVLAYMQNHWTPPGLFQPLYFMENSALYPNWFSFGGKGRQAMDNPGWRLLKWRVRIRIFDPNSPSLKALFVLLPPSGAVTALPLLWQSASWTHAHWGKFTIDFTRMVYSAWYLCVYTCVCVIVMICLFVCYIWEAQNDSIYIYISIHTISTQICQPSETAIWIESFCSLIALAEESSLPLSPTKSMPSTVLLVRKCMGNVRNWTICSAVAANSPMLGDFKKKNRSKEGHSNNMGTKILIALCMCLHAYAIVGASVSIKKCKRLGG